MKLTLVQGSDLGKTESLVWAGIQQARPEFSSPYFRPEFTRLVASVRSDAWVGILEDQGEIVGFFPFQRGRNGVGKPVGGPLSDYQGFVVKEGVSWTPEWLIRQAGLAVWDFDHLIESQAEFKAYHRIVEPSPIMDLSAGFEAYAAERRAAGSEQIKKTQALERKLAREHGAIRFEAQAQSSSVLETLLRWKSDQYRDTQKVDVFSYEWTVEILRRLLCEGEPAFCGILSALYASDRMIAGHVGMRSGGVLHYWFPSYDPEFARYSPGLVLLLKIAGWAQEAGIRKIDLGKGDALYKQRLSNASARVAEGSVEVSAPIRAARWLLRTTESVVKKTPLRALARIPARLLRSWQKRSRFR